MSPKITLSELRDKLLDSGTPRIEIEKYIIIDKRRSRPFSPALTFNPETVELDVMNVDEETQGQLAFDFANKIERTNRKRSFDEAIRTSPARSILYAEGDSWFQFPFFLRDLIDDLGMEYLIYDTSKAGDTLKDMLDPNKREYLNTLTRLIHLENRNVQGFLFSGAGNDVIGSDEENISYLQSMVKDFDPNQSLEWHLDTEATRERLAFIESAYQSLFESIETRFPFLAFPNLRVFIHGYDYVQVKSLPDVNPDKPFWAANWTGDPLRAHNFPDNETGSSLIRILIDKLNAITRKVCEESPRGVYVDLRGTVLPTQWADELHADDHGFANAAKKFSEILKSSGVQTT